MMPHDVTRFADGFTRRTFSAGEILHIQDLDLVEPDENFELLQGEVVPMQSKTHRHELVKSALTIGLVRALPDHLWLGVESTMYLTPRTLLEPDIVIYRRGIKLEEVKGSDILLAVEVSLTTLRYDLGRKAAVYARQGVHELWVVDVKRLVTQVHRAPLDGTWTAVAVRTTAEPLTHAALPGFSLRLDAL